MEAKACEELQFDPLVVGSEWNSARRLIFEFIKRCVPGQPLGPRWEPPVGSALALKLLAQPPLSPSFERELHSQTRTSVGTTVVRIGSLQ